MNEILIHRDGGIVQVQVDAGCDDPVVDCVASVHVRDYQFGKEIEFHLSGANALMFSDMITERAGALDLRALLIKYIDHVGRCEGVDFLTDRRSSMSSTEWTDQEWSLLQELRDIEPTE